MKSNSKKTLPGKLALVAIALLGFAVLTSSALLVAFRTGLLFEFKADPVADQTEATIRAALGRELHAGDSRERVLEFFSQRHLQVEYDETSRRYNAEVYRSPDKAHQVILDIWIDASGIVLGGGK